MSSSYAFSLELLALTQPLTAAQPQASSHPPHHSQSTFRGMRQCYKGPTHPCSSLICPSGVLRAEVLRAYPSLPLTSSVHSIHVQIRIVHVSHLTLSTIAEQQSKYELFSAVLKHHFQRFQDVYWKTSRSLTCSLVADPRGSSKPSFVQPPSKFLAGFLKQGGVLQRVSGLHQEAERLLE